MNIKEEIISDDDHDMKIQEAQFTNVWVKEEPEPQSPIDPLDPRFVVKEESSEPEIVPEFEIEIEKPKPKKKKKYKKPTKTLLCDQCHFTTCYKRQLALHFKSKHEKAFTFIKCDLCEYVTNQNHTLWRHKSLVHKLEVPQTQSKFYGKHKEFQCEQCNYKTNYKCSLTLHERKHAAVKKFQCPLCEYKTAYKHHYDKHTRSHKEKSFFYKCDKCPFATKFAGHIQRHLAIIHNEVSENDYFCSLCNYSTCSKTRLNKHLKENTKATALKCKFKDCSFQTFVQCEFRRHKTTHFGEIYGKKAEKQKIKPNTFEDVFANEIKSKNFVEIYGKKDEQKDLTSTNNTFEDETDETNLPDNTAKSYNIDAEYTQKILNNFTKNFEIENFESANDNSQNTEIENAEAKDPEQIKAKFSSQAHLPKSSVKKKNTNKKKPEQIIAKYSSQVYLSKSSGKTSNTYKIDPLCKNIVIPVIEAVSGDKRFLCQKCEYKSNYKGAVKRHYHRQHTGNKIRPYQCKNCDFTTKTIDSIAKHNKRSLSETAVTCYDPQCDFTTIYKCEMVVHQKTHYKYHCSKCPHSCRNKGELTRHYAVAHLGAGIKCRYCNFVGSRKDSVLVHETIHTGEKPHKCTYCDYSTVREALLKIHMNRYHSEIKQKVTVINSEDLEDKIQRLQMFVPSLAEMRNQDGEKLKISDQRVSLSKNRILLGDRIVRIDDMDKINQINEVDVVSLMGMVGEDFSEQNQVTNSAVTPGSDVKLESEHVE